MKCQVCNSEMAQKEPWFFLCPSCGFAASILTAGSGRGIGGLEALRRKNFSSLLERLARSYDLAGKSLLEVGCAEGWFLEAARDRQMNVSAIEPSQPHAHMARTKGFAVTEGFFPADLPQGGRFDYIVFNDVFEHLPNPAEAIRVCEQRLLPGGVLVLNLPSNQGVIYRIATLLAKFGRKSILERLWQKGLPSPHLSYFNPRALERFVSTNTSLRHVQTFALASISADGLRERINASHKGMVAGVINIFLLLALPLLAILPPDITVAVFEKTRTSMD